MRTASIHAHVKRIWKPEEDISLLGSIVTDGTSRFGTPCSGQTPEHGVFAKASGQNTE
jgi:hypothetical protein